MKIVVLIKEVPDTYGQRVLSLETGLADRTVGEAVLDEIGERALEVALSYKDANPDTEIVAMSMAPEAASATVRKALAMGADSGVHIVDDGLVGADLGLTAEVLAAALRRSGYDLIVTGNLSTDGSAGVLPAMIAEHLDVPNVTNLIAVEITADAVSGERAADDYSAKVTSPLPALISVTESMPDGRFPSFKGIMAAKKKPLETLALGDLGVTAERDDVSRSIVLAVSERPPREAGVKIVDEGDAGEQLAEFLVKNGLV